MADYERSLVSCWDMSTVNPPDLGWIGQGADMTGVGLVAATDIVEGVGGGRALEFNGTDEYVIRNTADWRSEDSQGSISAWIKRATSGVRHTIFGSGDAGSVDHGIRFDAWDTDFLIIWQASGPIVDQIRGSTTLTAGIWYHVVVVSDGSNYSLFVNGVQETLTVLVGTNSGDWFADTELRDNLTIGCFYRNALAVNFFDGAIDTVRIYSAALTPLQVADLYNRTRRGMLR